MISFKNSIFLFLSSSIFNIIGNYVSEVQSHGYMKEPRSRSFVAYEDGVWYSNGDSDVYSKETCPHCANIGGLCGVIGPHDYNLPRSITGDVMPADPQGEYNKGDVITVEIILTAHHMGHFEFNVCPIVQGEVPTQNCFDDHPQLEFVSDELYGATQDPNYPHRAYVPPRTFAMNENGPGIVPGLKYKYQMRLPPSVSGDLVLLQWHYITSNTCLMPGYNNYNFPLEWNYSGSAVGPCRLPIPTDGGSSPEQFWNCAEIKIRNNLTPTTPSSNPVESPVNKAPPIYPTIEPTPAVTASPVNSPTLAPVNPPIPAPVNPPAPVNSPTLPPVNSPTFPPVNPPTSNPPPTTAPINLAPEIPCGNGVAGNGRCQDITKCCSSWGWCDNTPFHCAGTNNPQPTAPTAIITTPAPTIITTPAPGPTFAVTPPPIISPTNFCGNGNIGDGGCEDRNSCCSAYGWCGIEPVYCNRSNNGNVTTLSPTTMARLNPTSNSNYCGNGIIGNGICENSNMCCSSYGWCGTDPAWCDENSDNTLSPPTSPLTGVFFGWCGTDPAWCDDNSDNNLSPPTSPLTGVSSPTQSPTSTNLIDYCGDGMIGNGICEDTTLCCSAYGWCGTDASYCSSNNNNSTSPISPPNDNDTATSPPTATSNITPIPTISSDPNVYCGDGNVGNGLCEVPNMCCSSFGYCGFDSVNYCNNNNNNSTPSTSSPVVSSSTTTSSDSNEYCGNGNVGNGSCWDPDMCCSFYGYCGFDPVYCDNNDARIFTTNDYTAISRDNTNYCGYGSIGNGVCEDSNMCCSSYGWCGTDPAWCDDNTNTSPPPPTLSSDTTIVYGWCGTDPAWCDDNTNTSPPPPTLSSDTTTSIPATSSDTNNEYCRNGNVGNGICEDTNLCCSSFGWCGTDSVYCQSNDNNNNNATAPPTMIPNNNNGGNDATPTTASNTTPTTVSSDPNEYCGNGNVGNGICQNPNMCCSLPYGYCGSDPVYCNNNDSIPPTSPPNDNTATTAPPTSSGIRTLSPTSSDPTPLDDNNATTAPPTSSSVTTLSPTSSNPTPSDSNNANTLPPTTNTVTTLSPTTSSDSSEYCGNGMVGNGICWDPNMCCSSYGHCGFDPVYCNNNSNSNPPASPSPDNDNSTNPPPTTSNGITTLSPTTSNEQNNATNHCGYGFVGNGQCRISNECCSPFGWCGMGSAYCQNSNANPCGNGVIGNSICSDPTLCCSTLGYCGTSSAYCNT
eukprot:CAMPEP_0194159336 /NCGR_PEP_ID=MMETSP0152-20130528/77771_1 /TAXON_ID=1049557 /ORGANISM="Thalassiothrix antarctica, Strain L6-D1" /LENGTH=1225 /DNA_ID=CAMNT_0038868891 /DNA_START=132 /DNA_END=3811 /DNA_ORIENTATION=+